VQSVARTPGGPHGGVGGGTAVDVRPMSTTTTRHNVDVTAPGRLGTGHFPPDICPPRLGLELGVKG